MTLLIKDRKVAADSWLPLESAETLPPSGDLLVRLGVWLADRERLIARGVRLGVRLEPGDDPAALAADVHRLGLIAVNFPAFADGRGYSTARLLRERYGYRGELRAIGDVKRDQLFYLARVGFDAFLLAEGQDADDALSAFDDFSEAYQASVERPSPLFRRRQTA